MTPPTHGGRCVRMGHALLSEEYARKAQAQTALVRTRKGRRKAQAQTALVRA